MTSENLSQLPFGFLSSGLLTRRSNFVAHVYMLGMLLLPWSPRMHFLHQFPSPVISASFNHLFVVIPQALVSKEATLKWKGPKVYGDISTLCLGVLVGQQTFTPKLVLLDLSDISCVQDVAKGSMDCYGCVDILINNASMKVKGPAHRFSLGSTKRSWMPIALDPSY